MKVLVTGAGGFIGSHVCEALLGRGHHVRAMVRYTSEARWGHLAELPVESRDGLEVVLGDVRDADQMLQFVQGRDAVLHLAALVGIPYSYQAPESYLSTNTVGTLHVLQACRKAGVGRVIVTSTSEVYGTAAATPMDETHALRAQSPYAASKVAADMLTESFIRSFDLPAVVLRPFNTYGPRQSLRAVIPSVLAQAIAGAEAIELGNLEPQRDLTYVEDTAGAFVLALEAAGIEGETIHFGQGRAYSVGEIAERCLAVVKSPARIVSVAHRRRPDKSEVGLLLCNAAKARRLLGWEPLIPFDEGLRRTADYLIRRGPVERPRGYVT